MRVCSASICCRPWERHTVFAAGGNIAQVCVCVRWVCACAYRQPCVHLPSPPPLLHPYLTSPSKWRKTCRHIWIRPGGDRRFTAEATPPPDGSRSLTAQLFASRCKGERWGGGRSSSGGQGGKKNTVEWTD